MMNTKYIKQSIIVAVALVLSSCGGSDSGEPTPPPVEEPKSASLVFPVKDSECNEGTIVSDAQSTITFEWNASENTDSYTVVIENLNTNQSSNTNSSGVTADITLQRGVPYSWKVISKSNKTAKTAESETWKFYNAGVAVENYAPFPAELVGPAMGGLSSTDTTLEWTGSDVDNDITGYDVYLDTANPPTTLLEEATTSTSVDANGLTVDTVYYWKVITKDSHNNETGSPIFEFRTQ